MNLQHETAQKIELNSSQFESLKFALDIRIPVKGITVRINDYKDFIEHFLGSHYEQIKDNEFVSFEKADE